jgi:beta-galactosidase
MRREIGLNRDWLYRPEFSESWLDTHYEIDSQWESVCLPHSNLELPYNGFDERDSQFLSTYIKDMFLPDFKEGERVILDFQAVMTVAFVWIDGKPAGEHKGGYTPFSIDITPLVHSSGKSRILVRVDSTERSDIPPFGAVLDYLCYGGIYRTVALRIVPDCHMENIKIVPLGAGSYEKSVETEFYIQNRKSRKIKYPEGSDFETQPSDPTGFI